jgi:hypothetical protein
MPDFFPWTTKVDENSPWHRVCQVCNTLYQDKNSWWYRIAHDPQIVPRVDENCITLRLGGIEFLILEPRGTGVHGRMAPEFLLRTHPGSRFVLSEDTLSPQPSFITSLTDLGQQYDQVRRRVWARSRRNQAVLDRLFLRHVNILAVATPLSLGMVDLVVVSPQGVCLLYLLRSYKDPSLRRAGPGGVAHLMDTMNLKLEPSPKIQLEVQLFLERMRALGGPWQTRVDRFPDLLTLYPRIRLVIYDFDQAQRQAGLGTLLLDLEKNLSQGLMSGLDQEGWDGDIFTIGDPGNISHKLLLSGT